MYGYWRRARVNLFAPNCGSSPPRRYTMYLLPEPTNLYLYNNTIIAKRISRRVSFRRFMVYKILKRVDGGHLLLYTVIILYIASSILYCIIYTYNILYYIPLRDVRNFFCNSLHLPPISAIKYRFRLPPCSDRRAGHCCSTRSHTI